MAINFIILERGRTISSEAYRNTERAIQNKSSRRLSFGVSSLLRCSENIRCFSPFQMEYADRTGLMIQTTVRVTI